jgi:UDP-glucuronate 4-epimerase
MKQDMKKILVTGAAGFIGAAYARKLCGEGYDVTGIDNLNPYYDVSLKKARLRSLEEFKNFRFEQLDMAERSAMERLFRDGQFDVVVNLAAQPGVRYSIENPHAYIDSNIVGFTNILEGCRHNKVKHLIFASSSSVYGANTKLPFSVADNVDHPISLYAATKKAGELMAHTYAYLYRLPCTGLRFFTVYGPWGRPDMAVYKFTKAIYEGQPIDIYNHGDMRRDFTYVDDIVEAMARLVEKIPAPDEQSHAPYHLYNIGNNNPEQLMDLISFLEEEIGIKAQRNMLPMQPGDVYATYADTDDLARDTGFKPYTPLKTGVKKFVEWYKEYHGVDAGVARKKA